MSLHVVDIYLKVGIRMVIEADGQRDGNQKVADALSKVNHRYLPDMGRTISVEVEEHYLFDEEHFRGLSDENEGVVIKHLPNFDQVIRIANESGRE